KFGGEGREENNGNGRKMMLLESTRSDPVGSSRPKLYLPWGGQAGTRGKGKNTVIHMEGHLPHRRISFSPFKALCPPTANY
ncbi:9011_t:CDS:1, partial [Acaulospora colombiana]